MRKPPSRKNAGPPPRRPAAGRRTGSWAATEETARPPSGNGHEPSVPGRPRLGELLLQREAVDADTLREALTAEDRSGQRLGARLLAAGAIDEATLAAVLSEQLGVPLVSLRDIVPEPEALAKLSEPVARSHKALPLRIDGDVLEVVVADPTAGATTELAAAAGMPVRLVLGTESELLRLIDGAYRVLGDVDRFVRAFETEAARIASTATAGPGGVDRDAPVVQVLNLMLTQALRDRASDVHIEPQDEGIRVRFRIDGALHDALELPASMAPALSSRLKIMATLNIVERRKPQDGQFSLEIDGRPIDMRLSVLPTIWGEKSVIRILDTRRSALHLHELGMPEDTFETFSRIVHSPFGMVLCAGPTGSGKTTTLYGALREINEAHRNITTIEDPVEYVFPSINQIQTNEQAGMTFATGLKSILRQDPDVILVGEIRDAETARIATQSALTGHLVLSTLHGTDAVAALHRLLDMGIESFLIASSVVAVVGQRLVRRVCTACVEPYEPTAEELAFYEESGGKAKEKFVHGVGCSYCANTGFRDRIGIYELLKVTPEIKRLVVGWATQDELRRMAVQQGMRTLAQEAIGLVEDDVTTVSEIIRSIYGL